MGQVRPDEPERLVTLKQRSRPLRLAFLVDPRSKTDLGRAIEACTCRFGGVFNPIIPSYRRRPAWLRRAAADRGTELGGVTEGLLEVFEPDFVVEFRAGAAADFGWPSDLVIPAAELDRTSVRGVERHGGIDAGITASLVYSKAWESTFRFQLRRPGRVVLPEPASVRDAIWVSAIFGRLPAEGPASSLRMAYLHGLEATELEVDGTNFAELVVNAPAVMTPLRMTAWELHLEPRARDLALFLLFDPTSAVDITHLWNLRALGLRFWPVPLQHAPRFPEAFSDALGQNQLEVQGDRGPIVSPAPSISLDVADELVRTLAGCSNRQSFLQHTIRGGVFPIWDARDLRARHIARVSTYWSETETEMAARNDRVQFTCPPFDTPDQMGEFSSYSHHARWASVVTIRDDRFETDLAEVFPPDIGDLRAPLQAVGSRYPITSTSEGLVVRCNELDRHQYWGVLTGTSMFQYWLTQHEMRTHVSSAGRTAQEFIRAIGGIRAAHWVGAPALIRTIGNAVHDPGGARVIQYGTLRRVLNQINDKNDAHAAGHLRFLVERVLQVHMGAKCPRCGQQNWYAPNDLHDDIQCRRCLRAFSFPAHQPPARTDWAYRPVGAFAMPNYAAGAYSVALALRFFGGMTGFQASERSWTVSLEDRREDTAFEIDFGVWLRPDLVDRTVAPELVLGEAKTFNRFERKDFDRAQRLLDRFPDAYVAFATLNDELDRAERAGLRRLLGKRRRGDGQPFRGRLIVLTATELCDTGYVAPTYMWERLGGRHAEIAGRHPDASQALEALSDATLELYADWSGHADPSAGRGYAPSVHSQ